MPSPQAPRLVGPPADEKRASMAPRPSIDHTSATAPAERGRSSRDARLDFWRGLCLVDVVLVHLAYNAIGFPEPLDSFIKHDSRFAAGGFVLLAGFTVATVFRGAVEGSGAERRAAYRRLWRRAAWLILADALAAGAYQGINVLRAYPDDLGAPAAFVILDVLLLRRPGLTGGIFVFYATMLALMPLVFEAKRRAGAWPLGIASGAVYLVAVGTAPSSPPPGFSFPWAFWQAPFMAGVLFAPAFPRILRGGSPSVASWTAASTLLFLFLLRTVHGQGRGAELAGDRLAWAFTKTPLMPGALLRYLSATHAVMAWTTLLWQPLSRSLAVTTAAVALLGRNSLVVYVAHVFTEIPLLELVWSTWPPAPVRVAMAVLDLSALLALALAVERDLVGTMRSLLARGLLAFHGIPARAVAAALLVTLRLSGHHTPSIGDGEASRGEPAESTVGSGAAPAEDMSSVQSSLEEALCSELPAALDCIDAAVATEDA